MSRLMINSNKKSRQQCHSDKAVITARAYYVENQPFLASCSSSPNMGYLRCKHFQKVNMQTFPKSKPENKSKYLILWSLKDTFRALFFF